MDKNTCQKCGSHKIINNATIIDHGHMDQKRDLSIHIKTTDRVFFNTYEKGKLLAQICGSCGNVEFAISNPEQLYKAFLKNKSI